MILAKNQELWLRAVTHLKELCNSLYNLHHDVGRALVQAGETSQAAKPFKSVGSAVYEIVKRYDTDTYRVVYAVKIGETIYVLHAFQKKSKQGIKTPQADIELIKQRYKDAVLREKQQ
jgi:phage-related protein